MPLLATPPITWAYKPSPSESLFQRPDYQQTFLRADPPAELGTDAGHDRLHHQGLLRAVADREAGPAVGGQCRGPGVDPTERDLPPRPTPALLARGAAAVQVADWGMARHVEPVPLLPRAQQGAEPRGPAALV